MLIVHPDEAKEMGIEYKQPKQIRKRQARSKNQNCDICGKVFYLKLSLVQHQQTEHESTAENGAQQNGDKDQAPTDGGKDEPMKVRKFC